MGGKQKSMFLQMLAFGELKRKKSAHIKEAKYMSRFAPELKYLDQLHMV